jgi:multicomponent Na+:H+ antiporter subunit C
MNLTYNAAMLVCMLGLYTACESPHYMKKLIGLSVFQSAIFLFYLHMGKIYGAIPPFLGAIELPYSSPLPQVLMLTAIVVGVATLAVGLALLLRIQAAYGTLDEREHSLAPEDEEGIC